MKRLWNAANAAGLQSTLSSIGATVGQHMKMASGADQKAGVVVPPDKQYLRLPLESARKLRWFDKEDVAKLVKVVAQEKKELMDTIAALKKLLIRAGFTDSNLDAEIKHILMHAEAQREADEGVTVVLLAAAQAELESLTQQRQSLQDEVDELKQKLAEAGRPSYSITDGKDGWEWDESPHSPGVDPQLVVQLTTSMENYERCNASAVQAWQAVRQQEQAVHSAEQAEAMQLLMEQQMAAGSPSARSGHTVMGAVDGGADADAQAAGTAGPCMPPSPLKETLSLEPSPALLNKLQRLELEKRAQAEHLESLQAQLEQLSASSEAAARSAEVAARSQAAVGVLEDRCRGLQGQVEGLQGQLQGAKEAARAAEEVAEKRAVELKRVSANMDAMRKYQDMANETAANLSTEVRRSQRAEARVTKLEGEVKEAVAELRAAQKQLVTMQLSHEQLQKQLVAAESAAEQARTQAEAAKNAEIVSQLSEQVRSLESSNATLQRDLHAARSSVGVTEQRLQQVELREAQLMAEVREAESVASENEQLHAEVDALRMKLEESRSERGQLAHYKQALAEAEGRRSRCEEELVATAQLVTQLEARLRNVQGQAEECKTEAERADARARQAESSVAAEVERRLANAGNNRAMWPPGAQAAVAQMESKVESLQAALAAVRHQLEGETLAHQRGSQQKLELQRKVIDLEDRCSRTEAAARERISELEEAVRCAQQDAEAAHDVILKLEQEMNELALEASTPTAFGRRGLGNGSTSSSPAASRRSTSSGSIFKTHRVGGGGLLSEPASQPVSPSSLHSELRGKLGGVDVVYLKNVLLKFLEAQINGRTSERDALLPAIASILQASPKEFHALKQLLQGSGTMFSALGIKL